MTARYVVISGAGLAGLTLAWWLERSGWQVTLVEKAPGPRDAGYMMDFFGPGYDAVEEMGLLPRLAEVHHEVAAVDYVDREGAVAARLDYDTFRALCGGRLLSVMRGDLEETLRRELGRSVDIRFGTTLAEALVADDRVELVLDDGEVLTADLLVGADGVHSRVRELLFGQEQQFVRHLGYHTAAYVFRDRAVAEATADTFRLHAVPGRQAGCYPLGDGRLASFFVHVDSGPAPGDPRTRLREVYGDLGWEVPRILDALPEHPADLYYDSVAQVVMPSWVQPRVALVGDACQAVSLLAGQGASLAIGGARALAEELDRAALPHALVRYQSRLQPVVRRRQATGRRTADWFLPDRRWKLALRNGTLRLADSPWARGTLRAIRSEHGPGLLRGGL